MSRKRGLSEQNSVILSATWPSNPLPSSCPLQQAPESAAHLFFMALLHRLIPGCFDSRVLRIDLGKSLVWPRAGKHAGTRCKTGRQLTDLSYSFHWLLNKEKQTFLPRFASGFVAHFTLQVSFSGWSRIGLRSVDGGGRWRTVNSLCGVCQRWLLCWAGTVFCLHVGMHMISSSARRWHLNNGLLSFRFPRKAPTDMWEDGPRICLHLVFKLQCVFYVLK